MIDRTGFSQRASRAGFGMALAVLAGIATVPCDAVAGGPSDQAVRGAQPVAATNDRFIIKLKDASAGTPSSRVSALASRSGRAITYVREMSGGAHVVRIAPDAATAAILGQSVAERNRLVALQLMQDPDVVYAEPDRKLFPMLVPNDSLYPQQWNYFEALGGINLPAAWDITTGSASIVVAVIDTGIRPHVDLAGRTVPGYDFIGDTTVSNDGDGRDADPSDPGDYGCGRGSSWHGTHVAGTVGAASNNGSGVAGVNWVSKILPARVLGVCGGYISDIADAVRWSSGIAVPGVPANANPARVENLSLGGTEPCSNTMQGAITDAVARGTVVVVAAGNENSDVATSEPANCSGVIAVGATGRNGARANFSNYGSGVTISAPGGSILSTLNAGSTVPGADSYAFYSGTSMSTPHVAGVVSLMLSQNPSMTPAQVKTKLQSSARAFPTGTVLDCTTALCGAGIVDAAAAVAASTNVTRVNLAAQSSGGVASASSTYGPGFAPSSVNDGDRRSTNGGNNGWWNDATGGGYPDWVRIDFPASTSVSEIDVYTIQDNWQSSTVPTDATTFSQYGLRAFDVQYWNGSAWLTVPGGSVVNNSKVVTRITFAAIATTAIRIQVNAAADGWTRIAEVEAYNDAPAVNVARSANGGIASASSTYGPGFAPSEAIDGDRRGTGWGTTGGWNNAAVNTYPEQLQVTFNAAKSIGEIDVFTLQDNWQTPVDPTVDMTFSRYGITAYDVQYWSGSAWLTVPGGTVNGNDRVWRKFTFTPVTTTAIRINVRGAADGYIRITEVEAYVAP